VLITHAACLRAGDVVAGYLRLRPDGRQLVVLPLFHGNGRFYSTMSALVTGASIGLAPRFSASRWSERAAVMEATVASLFAAPVRMYFEGRWGGSMERDPDAAGLAEAGMLLAAVASASPPAGDPRDGGGARPAGVAGPDLLSETVVARYALDRDEMIAEVLGGAAREYRKRGFYTEKAKEFAAAYGEPRDAWLRRSDVARAFFIASGRRLLPEEADWMRT